MFSLINREQEKVFMEVYLAWNGLPEHGILIQKHSYIEHILKVIEDRR